MRLTYQGTTVVSENGPYEVLRPPPAPPKASLAPQCTDQGLVWNVLTDRTGTTAQVLSNGQVIDSVTLNLTANTPQRFTFTADSTTPNTVRLVYENAAHRDTHRTRVVRQRHQCGIAAPVRRPQPDLVGGRRTRPATTRRNWSAGRPWSRMSISAWSTAWSRISATNDAYSLLCAPALPGQPIRGLAGSDRTLHADKPTGDRRTHRPELHQLPVLAERRPLSTSYHQQKCRPHADGHFCWCLD